MCVHVCVCVCKHVFECVCLLKHLTTQTFACYEYRDSFIYVYITFPLFGHPLSDL